MGTMYKLISTKCAKRSKHVTWAQGVIDPKPSKYSDKIIRYLQRGCSYVDRRKYGKAVVCFTEAIYLLLPTTRYEDLSKAYTYRSTIFGETDHIMQFKDLVAASKIDEEWSTRGSGYTLFPRARLNYREKIEYEKKIVDFLFKKGETYYDPKIGESNYVKASFFYNAAMTVLNSSTYRKDLESTFEIIWMKSRVRYCNFLLEDI